jgi:hypothetical protein
MTFEQRELAFQAKDAASNCLAIFLNSQEYRSVHQLHPFQLQNTAYADGPFNTPIRAALRYAVHDSLVTAAFSGLFLLKMASLFPRELDLGAITSQVEQMAQLLSEVAAERCVSTAFDFLSAPNAPSNHRYAFTLRIMLANLRRKVGMPSGVNPVVQTGPPPSFAETMVVSPTYVSDPGMPAPFTMEELGFSWPQEGNFFNPAAIPPWLQEQVSPLLVSLVLARHSKNVSLYTDHCITESQRPWPAGQWFGRHFPSTQGHQRLVRRFPSHARGLVTMCITVDVLRLVSLPILSQLLYY